MVILLKKEGTDYDFEMEMMNLVGLSVWQSIEVRSSVQSCSLPAPKDRAASFN